MFYAGQRARDVHVMRRGREKIFLRRCFQENMERTPTTTALRFYCAERTRAMQLICMCASRLVPIFYRMFVPGMKRGISLKRLLLFPVILYLAAAPSEVWAAQQKEYTMPPHLIQSVTEQDAYESMVRLGMLECPVLETVDCEKAYESVNSCIVRVGMGNAYGSGILWKLTADEVIIATNRHVLDYWRDEDSYVLFPQGYYMDAEVLGVSEEKDVGFLSVDNGQFTYRELESLRRAPVESGVFEQLKQGDAMFCVGAGPETGEMIFYLAEMEDTHRYIDDFDSYMLYGHGYARTGMSGGGIFDGYGHLIGMLTGGTMRNEIAGVPLPDLAAAYQDIVEPEDGEDAADYGR